MRTNLSEIGYGSGEPAILPGGYTMTFKASAGDPWRNLETRRQIFPWDPYYPPIWEIDELPYESYPMYDGMTIAQDLSTRQYASLWSTGGSWRYLIWDLMNNVDVAGDEIIGRIPDSNPPTDRPRNILSNLDAGTYEVFIGSTTDYDMIDSWFADIGSGVKPTSSNLKLYWNVTGTRPPPDGGSGGPF